MNDIGIALVWLAVQATLVLVAGLLLTMWLARRAPRTGVVASRVALGAVLVLTGLAFLHLPAWWAWNVTAEPSDHPAIASLEPVSASEMRQPESASASHGLSVTRLTSLLRLLKLPQTSITPDDQPVMRWPGMVAAALGTGTAIGLLRLVLALCTLRRLSGGSQPVHDTDLRTLIEELRPLVGVTRPVGVYESDGMTTPAAVGWRRPLLLLPADWRTWTSLQRRAAIAHELAHVANGDFPSWVLARLCVALYFWHPLVRILAKQLQLQQELVADAAAAQLSGGRPTYLRALAELILQFDQRGRHGWPAPAFVSRTSILIRRIAMLRATNDHSHRPATRLSRWCTVGVLGFLTLTASALRGPADEVPAKPATKQQARARDIAPFDLSLLVLPGDKDVDGIYALRPAALVKRPGTERQLKFTNQQIDMGLALLGLGHPGIHIEDVDQVMGRMYFKGENKAGKHSLMLSANVLRTTRDVDWVKLRHQCTIKFTLHHYKGETYASCQMPFLGDLVGRDGRAYLWGADARTLINDSEDNIRSLIEAKLNHAPAPLPAYAAGWDGVSRDLIAFAIDNRGQRLIKKTVTAAETKKALADPSKPEYTCMRFYQQLSTAVLGTDGDDAFAFVLRATADSSDAAARMARECRALVATAKGLVSQEKHAKDAAVMAAARQLLDGATIRQDGTVVTLHAAAASGLNDVIRLYMQATFPHDK